MIDSCVFGYCPQSSLLFWRTPVDIATACFESIFFSVIGLSAMWNFCVEGFSFLQENNNRSHSKRNQTKSSSTKYYWTGVTSVLLLYTYGMYYFDHLPIQCKEEKHWINSIFSHGWASKAPAPSHNIVCGISSVSDGLQAQLGDKAALACLVKRAFHVSFF